MSTTTKKASELKTGERLFFPNSRHAQEVTFVSTEEEDTGNGTRTLVTVQADPDVRWMVPGDFDVNVEVSESDT